MYQPLLASIYGAALHPAEWPSVLAQSGVEFNAHSSFLFTCHSASEPTALLVASGMDDQFVPQFLRDWVGEDEWAGAAMRTGNMRAGSVVTGRQLLTSQALQRTRFYNEFLSQHHIEEMLGSVVFDGSDGVPFTNLCWYRPAGAAPFSGQHALRLRELLPHFRQALRLYYQARELNLARQLHDHTCAACGVASLVIDEQGRISQCNREAAALLDRSDSPLHCSGRQLLRLGRRCVPSLAQALRQSRLGPSVRLLVQWGNDACMPLGASVSALPVDADCAIGPVPGRCYLLLLEMRHGDCGALCERAAQLYGLTTAERRVLSGLLGGANAEGIAGQCGTTLNTVRSQIKSIMGKAGVKRQAELLRMLSIPL